MINILVTGSSGLVGKALSNILDVYKINFDTNINLICLTSKDADLCNYETSFKHIQNIQNIHNNNNSKIDGIIHLAANVGGLFKNMSYPVEMIESNLFMNTNILKIAHELDINNVIMCLSTCIFPDSVESYPITIDDLHKGPPHSSNEGYAYAKRICDSLTRAYQKQYNRRYFCVVPTNIYGPHDNYDLNDAHVIPALIHKCWLAKKTNTQFIVAGNGSPLRQFIFSEDLAYLILWSYINYTNISKPLILCPPNSEVSISQVVETIATAFDYKEAFVYDTSKPNGQYKKTVNSNEIYVQKYRYTCLNDGLIKTVNWFMNNINNNIRGINT